MMIFQSSNRPWPSQGRPVWPSSKHQVEHWQISHPKMMRSLGTPGSTALEGLNSKKFDWYENYNDVTVS